MIGIVDVGGGLRGSFGAGVFDFCLDRGIRFPYTIGVSAGSANVASYLAGQRGRNLLYYTEYAARREYMSLGNFLKKGSYLDLDYIYGTLSNSGGEYPLDYPAMLANPAQMKIVCTNAVTGLPAYFDKADMRQDDYGAIKASSCLPAINKPYIVQGIPYYDGGISDPIPFDRAFADGCDRVVVILTRPKDYHRTVGNDRRFAHLLGRYPGAQRALLTRADTYNRQLDRATALERDGKLLRIAPDDVSGMGTLSRDMEPIRRLYQEGYEKGAGMLEFLQGEDILGSEKPGI